MMIENWDDYRIFIEVVRLGTLTAASDKLRLTQPTIGRRISNLEHQLGQSLFIRQGKKLILSDFGIQLHKNMEAMQAAALQINRTIAKAHNNILDGTIRLTTTEGIGGYWLPKVLAQFSVQHPDLQIEIITGSAKADLSAREADIALRLYRPDEPYLKVQKMGMLEFGLFASHGYLTKHGVPNTVSELAGHRFIGFSGKSNRRPEVDWLGNLMQNIRFSFMANNAINQAQSANFGNGITLMPIYLAAYFPNLKPLLEDIDIPGRDLWMAAHVDIRNAPAVDAVWEFLKKQLSVKNDLISH